MLSEVALWETTPENRSDHGRLYGSSGRNENVTLYDLGVPSHVQEEVYRVCWGETTSRRALALTVTAQVSRCRKHANFGYERFGC